MTSIGTPLTASATRAMLLGSGELGKEVAIELMRLGVEVIACDSYAHAPAMQVAHRSRVLDMLDPVALRAVIEEQQPHLVIPEVEAIATQVLAEVESERMVVVPTARATQLTMNREGIRRLAAEELALPTSPYRFADSLAGLKEAVAALGVPCVVKPVMSSSGKGQSVVHADSDVEAAWETAKDGARAAGARVIVEGFVQFDYEVTQLTVRHRRGTEYLDPIGHLQVDGDYRESWQPQPMSDAALAESRRIAAVVTEALGGWGVFGVELFVRGDEVLFSEVSPRPHDTGLVTLISQDFSQFALHARAVLGLPVHVRSWGPAASCAVVVEGEGVPTFHGVADALAPPDTDLRLFGKPIVRGRRRMAVALARGADVDHARVTARDAAAGLSVRLAIGEQA